LSAFSEVLYIFLLKFFKSTSVCFLRSAGFSKDSVMNPLLLKVMTNSAFSCSPEQLSPVLRANLGHMLCRVKFLMNMATGTIFTNHLIILLRIKLPLKRTSKFEIGTTRSQNHNNNEKYAGIKVRSLRNGLIVP